MAKVILKTNLANRNYSVEHKVVVTPINEVINVNKVELFISPKNGYFIDAKDFISGFLPGEIASISYSNFGKKVVISIVFKEFVVS